jgi:SAM-dependent methyltransferase
MNNYTLVNNENPIEHWQYINVKDRVVLDLGCGRWEKVEIRDKNWLTTPEYFLANAAKKVVAIDADPEEIEWFTNKFNNDNLKFILKSINSTQDIIELYNIYKPDCVKCDIETNEKFLLGLTKEQFCSVKEYYIETHGNNLYFTIIDLLNKYNYSIYHQIDLTHTRGYCKVIFAKKK